MQLKMIKRVLLGLAIAAVATTSLANTVTLRPNIQGFNQVDLQSSGQLILRQGNQNSIRI